MNQKIHVTVYTKSGSTYMFDMPLKPGQPFSDEEMGELADGLWALDTFTLAVDGKAYTFRMSEVEHFALKVT